MKKANYYLMYNLLHGWVLKKTDSKRISCKSTNKRGIEKKAQEYMKKGLIYKLYIHDPKTGKVIDVIRK